LCPLLPGKEFARKPRKLQIDYETGTRIRGKNREQSLDRSRTNLLSRNVYSASNFAQDERRGIADTQQEKIGERFDEEQKRADVLKKRREVDVKESHERHEKELDRKRKLEASDLANIRAGRSFDDFQRRTLFNPDFA